MTHTPTPRTYVHTITRNWENDTAAIVVVTSDNDDYMSSDAVLGLFKDALEQYRINEPEEWFDMVDATVEDTNIGDLYTYDYQDIINKYAPEGTTVDVLLANPADNWVFDTVLIDRSKVRETRDKIG